MTLCLNSIMKKLIILSILFLSINLLAQNGNHKLGAWYNIGINYKVNPNFSWNSLSSVRLFNPTNQFQQNLLRTGVSYKITQGSYLKSKTNILVGVGIDYLHTNNFSNPELTDNNEYRTYQQVILKSNSVISGDNEGYLHKAPPHKYIYFNHRFRLEQRYRFINDNYQFVSRFRYKIGLTIPLTNKKLIDNTLFLSAYEELFFNQQKNPFEQNWTSVVLGYRLKGGTSITTGYFKQVLADIPFHRLSVGFKHTFKRKEKEDVVK